MDLGLPTFWMLNYRSVHNGFFHFRLIFSLFYLPLEFEDLYA